MNMLVVWSDVPDETFFIPFLGISEWLYRKMLEFNGKYINSDEDTEELSNLFYDSEGEFRFKKEKRTDPILNTLWDAVIHTGFIS